MLPAPYGANGRFSTLPRGRPSSSHVCELEARAAKIISRRGPRAQKPGTYQRHALRLLTLAASQILLQASPMDFLLLHIYNLYIHAQFGYSDPLGFVRASSGALRSSHLFTRPASVVRTCRKPRKYGILGHKLVCRVLLVVPT